MSATLKNLYTENEIPLNCLCALDKAASATKLPGSICWKMNILFPIFMVPSFP